MVEQLPLREMLSDGDQKRLEGAWARLDEDCWTMEVIYSNSSLQLWAATEILFVPYKLQIKMHAR